MSRPLLYALLLIGLSGPAQATDPSSAPGFAGSLAQMLLGLGIVIALLLLTLWLIKRLSVPRGGASGLKVLGAAAVGPRERVVLIEIADTVLVLGVTTSNVRTLHTFEADQLPCTETGNSLSAPRMPTGNEFAVWLKKSLERRKHED